MHTVWNVSDCFCGSRRMGEKESINYIRVLSQGQEIQYYYTFENKSRNRKKIFSECEKLF